MYSRARFRFKTDGNNTGSSHDCGGRLREKIGPEVPFIFLESVVFG